MASVVHVTCLGSAEHTKKLQGQDFNVVSNQREAFLGRELSVCEPLICNGVFHLGPCLDVAPLQHDWLCQVTKGVCSVGEHKLHFKHSCHVCYEAVPWSFVGRPHAAAANLALHLVLSPDACCVAAAVSMSDFPTSKLSKTFV